jgi:hypothetical protein
MNFQLKGFFLFLFILQKGLARLTHPEDPGLPRGRILMQGLPKSPAGGAGGGGKGGDGPYGKFPYLGATYTIQNKPYSDTILVPYIEPDNAVSGITVGANLVIATPNDVTPQGPSGKAILLKRSRRLVDRAAPPTATNQPI